MIHFIRTRNSRVERANAIDVSLDTQDFINDIVRDEKWMVHTVERREELTGIPHNDIVVLCGQGLVPQGQLLNNVRGYFDGTCIHTYDLQDAQDPFAIESHDDDEQDVKEGNNKDSAKTRWYNLRFWTRMDIAKALRRPTPQRFERLRVVHAEHAINLLNHIGRLGPQHLYFDIETRLGQVTCFSFSAQDTETVTFLCRDWTNQIQPGTLDVFVALSRALMRNTVVVHNCMYDLPFLTFHHGFPLPRRVYDTMCSHHRIFPESDKSLAHCLSLYTNYPNHKTSSINETHNSAQDLQLMEYNSRDVQVLSSIHISQLEYANRLGSLDSIECVNRSIPVYAKMGLRGIIVSTGERFIKQKQLQRRLTQLQRLADLALGQFKFELSSPKQCVHYFHNVMGLPPVEKTPSGNPSLKGDNLYVLALATENPMIPIIIEYRELDKEHSMLNFKSPDMPQLIP